MSTQAVKIDPKDVQKLRAETGAGVMDCKRALEEATGDLARARDILRQRGLAAAAKRATRETREGVVESYIHAGGRIGALVELTSETDFVARNPEFRELAKNIAMQIAAMSPLVVSEEDLSAEERAELVHRAHLFREIADVRRVDAEGTVAEQRLAAHLEQDALVLRGHASAGV